MNDFSPILEAARARNGGAEALEERLPVPKSAAELRATPDDRYLSLMSLRIFRAGLKHGMVDNKWPAFEEVFHGFNPKRVRAMNDEEVEALLSDKRLIRHGGKMRALHANAAALCALAEARGGFGAYLADWPGDNVVGLWEDLGKRFKQLGGHSAPTFLRMVGKDSFILTDYVVRALNHWGAVEGPAKGKRDRARVQEVFNGWAAATGRPLSQLSMILARSVD